MIWWLSALHAGLSSRHLRACANHLRAKGDMTSRCLPGTSSVAISGPTKWCWISAISSEMNVSAISKALLVKSLADSAAHGIHATIPFAEAVQQLSLLAEDSGNAGNRATSDVSEDIDSFIQVAINLASSNEVC